MLTDPLQKWSKSELIKVFTTTGKCEPISTVLDTVLPSLSITTIVEIPSDNPSTVKISLVYSTPFATPFTVTV